MALSFVLVTGDGAAFGRLSATTLPHIAAVLVVAAVAWLGYAVRPGLVAAGWVPVAWASVVLMFAVPLRLPPWLRRTSPFQWPANVPAESFDPVPVAGRTMLAIALTAAGFAALRARDIS